MVKENPLSQKDNLNGTCIMEAVCKLAEMGMGIKYTEKTLKYSSRDEFIYKTNLQRRP